MGQDFGFAFTDDLLAEVGQVPQSKLHLDVEAISKAYEAVGPVARRLGVEPPAPRLAGFCYTHLVALGCRVVYSENAEPTVQPLIHSLREIDELEEPEDYLANEVIQQRIRICEELQRRYPESPSTIGHLLEGPTTTATILMGPAFFTLPYDDPERAQRLLDFCSQSAVNYAHSIKKYFGRPIEPGRKYFPDDFAGIFGPDKFKEFVVPYWEKTYQRLMARGRSVHSELLRTEHLPFLKELQMDHFDPGADQYLTPEILSRHCPCKFSGRILSWHIHDLSAEELERMYRNIAKYEPTSISFSMCRLEEEPKIKHLLKVARQMQDN